MRQLLIRQVLWVPSRALGVEHVEPHARSLPKRSHSLRRFIDSRGHQFYKKIGDATPEILWRWSPVLPAVRVLYSPLPMHAFIQPWKLENEFTVLELDLIVQGGVSRAFCLLALQS